MILEEIQTPNIQDCLRFKRRRSDQIDFSKIELSDLPIREIPDVLCFQEEMFLFPRQAAQDSAKLHMPFKSNT